MRVRERDIVIYLVARALAGQHGCIHELKQSVTNETTPKRPAKCGKDLCWSTTADSAAQRMARIEADGLEEVAMFRIIQIPSEKWPEDFWWPLLAKFLAGGGA